SEELTRRAAGLRIYNAWLADACSVEPERHVGVVQIPDWDIDASLREIEWAREAGLGAVNFPAPRTTVTSFDDPAWEPFWSACESLGMPLTTHAGNVDLNFLKFGLSKVHTHAIAHLDGGSWAARRGAHWLIFTGVFERHPEL